MLLAALLSLGALATLPGIHRLSPSLARAGAGEMYCITPDTGGTFAACNAEFTTIQAAFDAVAAGDGETHNRLVAEGLQALMDKVDVIVLAQASMAWVVDALPEDAKQVPILSSPRLGIEAVRQVLTTA